MKQIKFQVGYSIPSLKEEQRCEAVSGNVLTEYIIAILNSLEYSVEIVSAIKTKKEKGSCSRHNITLGVNTLVMSPAFAGHGLVKKTLKTIQLNYWLLKYLLKNTKNGEQIIVYHEINKIPAILVAKAIKKLRYIMYVGEVYHEVSRHKLYQVFFENKILKNSDKYIFSSKLLEKKINVNHKPSIVIAGAYSEVEKYETSFGDNKIHIIYAGIIDLYKGAFMVAALEEYLPPNYVLHIAGYGTQEDVDKLQECIKGRNDRVIYEGLLFGEEYYRLLQKNQIGICPQIVDATYNGASFPSKIPIYLANGLRVVAPNVPAIKESVFGEHIYYYDEYSAKEIANTILGIDFNTVYDGRGLIHKCNKTVKEALKGLIENE